MQSFVSKLFEPFYDLLVGRSMPRPGAPVTDENNDQSSDPCAQIEAAPGIVPNKARQRLDGFSSYRIHPSEITYTSEGSHGSGGKAEVVQATLGGESVSDEQVVAVKKLRYHRGIDQKKFSSEFVHEVETMAGLSHENIVKLVGFVEDFEQGKAWIVLSWEPNGNVSEFLATVEREIPERVSLIQDTFEGVKYLHTRNPPICHGDLKSFNILVSSSYRAIITDFGSARAITELEDAVVDDESGRQAQGNPATNQAHPQIHVAAVGSQLTLTGPAYSLRWAPPEVMNGRRPRLSTDVWAAGWVCWEIMTGKLPFDKIGSAGAITLMVIQGEVPRAHDDAQLAQVVTLCSLMADCWAFDPKARPDIAQCCTELKWIPSFPPSDGMASDRGWLSIELLREMGSIPHKQCRQEKASTLFEQSLSRARETGNQRAASEALTFLGEVHFFQGKYSQSEESFNQAQEMYARLGDDQGRANTLLGLGHVHRVQSKYTQARESFTRAQEIYARLGNDQGRANTLHGLGHVHRAQSRYTQAEESYIRAQEIYARLGDDLGRANTLIGLGNLYLSPFKHTSAEDSFTRAQEIYARVGDDQGRANTLYGLGEVYRLQSKDRQAEELYTRARETYARVGDDLRRARSLLRLGEVYRLQSRYTQAGESLTRAQEIYGRLGSDQDRANTLLGLGHLRREEGRVVEAAPHYLEARDLYAQIGDTVDEEDAAYWLAVVS